jgi:hypothetical protein
MIDFPASLTVTITSYVPISITEIVNCRRKLSISVYWIPSRHNIFLEAGVYDEFAKYAGKKVVRLQHGST